MGTGIDVSAQALQKTIENLHDCKAELLEYSHVIETLEDDLVWGGDVQMFQMLGHSERRIVMPDRRLSRWL